MLGDVMKYTSRPESSPSSTSSAAGPLDAHGIALSICRPRAETCQVSMWMNVELGVA